MILPERNEAQLALAKATIDYARTQIGLKEARGDNNDTWVQKLQAWASNLKNNLIAPWLRNSPYCVMGASYSIDQASKITGIKSVWGRQISSNACYAWAKKNGVLLDAPEKWCVGLLHDESGNIHHTYLCSEPILENYTLFGMDEPFVYGVDFNWKNSVCRTMHPVRLSKFVRIC